LLKPNSKKGILKWPPGVEQFIGFSIFRVDW
jgi:hypothetical protein